MKKPGYSIIFLSFVFILSIISSNLALAADLPSGSIKDQVDSLNDARNRLDDIRENPQDTTDAYIKKEWTKLMEKTEAGNILLGMNAVLAGLGPVFKFLIGVDYSLSWFFFLSLLIWICIFVIIYEPIKGFFSSRWPAFAVAIIIPAIAAQFKMIEKTLSFFTPLISNKWMVTLSIFIALIIMFVYIKLVRTFKAQIKKKKKEEDERRREEKAKLVEKINDIKIRAEGKK